MAKVLLLISIFVLNTNSGGTGMDKLLWIVDKWISVNDSPGVKSYEEWVKVSDDLYEGSSRTEKDSKVTFSEKLKIENTPDGIFYVADVKHNTAPVKFKLTDVNDTLAVFENPEHDFPKKITYCLEEGNLHAWIEGPGKDGSTKKIDFYMTKMR
ncbi:MAG: hypothetical protein IAE90_04455 [Ignavibacteria bacterium]|nr:hypothetical protein [Ignavibacteria bacterium]